MRLGRAFEQRLRELVDCEKWSAGEIENHQNEKWRRLIRHAYDNVPFYGERWKALKISPEDIRRREDLQKLPVVTKDGGGEKDVARAVRGSEHA